MPDWGSPLQATLQEETSGNGLHADSEITGLGVGRAAWLQASVPHQILVRLGQVPAVLLEGTDRGQRERETDATGKRIAAHAIAGACSGETRTTLTAMLGAASGTIVTTASVIDAAALGDISVAAPAMAAAASGDCLASFAAALARVRSPF